mgnify:FL=1
MPIGTAHGLSPGDAIRPTGHPMMIEAGPGLLGRVIDAAGSPLDGKGVLSGVTATARTSRTRNPLENAPVQEALDVGVRAINALTSLGRGQRIGLFAGSGVGKSVLLSMMTRFTEADVTVIGLVGERGREVGDFVREVLGLSLIHI